jgi:hypothetical protein
MGLLLVNIYLSEFAGKCANSPSYEMNRNTLSDVMREPRGDVNRRVPKPGISSNYLAVTGA